MKNKTAMTELIEFIDSGNIKDTDLVINKAIMLLQVEKTQLFDFYIRGRNDNHLDWYPEKHAKEEYDLVFNKKEDGKD
mgnify:CR=1 FL=1